MSDLVRGLLAMYAVAGLGTALVFLAMKHSHSSGLSVVDWLKALSLVVVGPVGGWFALWSLIEERLARRAVVEALAERAERMVHEARERMQAKLDEALSQQAVAHRTRPPHGRHLWN